MPNGLIHKIDDPSIQGIIFPTRTRKKGLITTNREEGNGVHRLTDEPLVQACSSPGGNSYYPQKRAALIQERIQKDADSWILCNMQIQFHKLKLTGSPKPQRLERYRFP